jgi:hypothetical protein
MGMRSGGEVGRCGRGAVRETCGESVLSEAKRDYKTDRDNSECELLDSRCNGRRIWGGHWDH